ncbi:ATP-binding protein [Vibrio neptunius]|uniref:histidine kinase n=1 Tax=Vibrio neptunius TaxID=170651 RepID=A0ABS3A809_9VIBR|nr:ATP-binding protein [Vibrio neptunius]MBN3494956.1 ammonium transporter [Vibrio neptunius]MBN3517376.1 ammonium transporter [Vibrio neptunius]MBN3551800.1 ammonium transporter [Vibrio neptunius]MBN3579792.1 ammonium transporter [Vibrio neptunius]MCH9873458.1 ammonium transporter [Vibrio neptunius]
MSGTDTVSILWLLVCTCIAFFMQAGFTLVETGSVRAKNSVNVAMKNMADFLVVSVVYVLVGFHLAQGSSLLSFDTLPIRSEHLPVVMFNLMFVATAATIVSGCVAERMSFRGYVYSSAFIGILIYPVASYWTWNPNSWLHTLGFYDFAGGVTVHVVGGMCGLVATMVIGPRKERFMAKQEVNELPSYNHTFVTLGVFLMVFAWMGFNGGSFYQFDARVPVVLFNTLLCAAVAGFVTLILVHRSRHVPVFVTLNSVLGGLVIVTVGADLFSTFDVVLLGVLASFTVYYGDKALIAMRIDDPVGAIPVHLFCGVLGGVYSGYTLSLTSNGDLVWDVGVQLIGILAILLWSGTSSYMCFKVLKYFHLERVAPDDEKLGLNITEHGVQMSWLETLRVIENISRNGDYSKRVPVELGTEAGDVAISFNHLMDRLESNIGVLHNVAKGNLVDVDIKPSSDKDIMANSLHSMIVSLRSLIDEVEDEIQSQAKQIETSEHSIQALIEKFKRTQDQLMEAEKMSALTGMVVGVAHELNTPLGITVTSLSVLSDKLDEIAMKFSERTITTEDLNRFLTVANECVEMVVNNIERSVAIVSKLKQINQKMASEEPKRVALRQMLDEAVLHVNETLTQKSINVEIQCEASLDVYLPPISLQCVIEELLNNSALHGFTADDHHSQRVIVVKVKEASGRIDIIVEDNGVGIPPENQKKIFQPFFTTLRAKGGTGLGLHMVYNICTQKLAGEIDMQSEINKGTRFVLSLESFADA